MNGFSESQHQIDERKQRISAGTYGRARSDSSAKPLDIETTYFELRHQMLLLVLSQVTRTCRMLEQANKRLGA